MVTYIYFVKCPDCEDEHFDFFDEAKEYAMGCLSQKPVITQTEVCRNDFGECTDSCDLGTVWSWEDMMGDLDKEDTKFSKAETFGISEGIDDFDDFDIGPQSDEFADIDNSVDFEIEDAEFADEASEPVTESVETKYWMCFYDGNDVGVVEAADEDEAMEAFMDSHNTLSFDSWDHDWSVEEISEEEYDEYEGGSYGGYEYDNEFDYNVDQAIDAMNRGLHEGSKRVPVSENASILDATLPAKDTDYVIAVRSQRVGSYTFLSMSYKLTPNLDRAMTYSSAYEAEQDIKYALDEAQRRGAIVNSYDTDRVFVTTVGKAKAFPGRYDLKALQQHNPTTEACERKPVPDGMTIEQLKETMEENEDMVECTVCEELFSKADGVKQGHGYVCPTCQESTVDPFDQEYPDVESEEDDLEDSASKTEVGRAVADLVVDEFEAVSGYEMVADVVKDSEVATEKQEEILATLDHIKDEEVEHIEELKELTLEDREEVLDKEDEVLEEDVSEEMVQCAGCEETFPKDECWYKEGIGWLCGDCEDRIVKCEWCHDLYDKSDCRWEVDFEGWLCDRCQSAIMSRGETLTFREGNYWDFLDEDQDPDKRATRASAFRYDSLRDMEYDIALDSLEEPLPDTNKIQTDEKLTEELSLSEMVKDSINHLTNDLGKDPWAEDFVDEVIKDIENNYNVDIPTNPKQYSYFCDAVAKEVSFQLNKNTEDDIDFDDVFNMEF